MSSIAGKRLQTYNRLFWENDSIYRQALRNLGLPETAFWILYALRADGENSESLTQSEIGRILFLPKQTLNSALKKLEADDVVRLCDGRDRRSKYVHLTDNGKKIAGNTVDRLIEIENATFEQLTCEEQDALLGTMVKFIGLFRENARVLDKIQDEPATEDEFR